MRNPMKHQPTLPARRPAPAPGVRALAALLLAAAPALSPAQEALGGLASAFKPLAPPVVVAPAPPVADPADPANPAPATPGTATGAGLPPAAPDTGLRVVRVGGVPSLAYIDGLQVRVGDQVRGLRVAQIKAQGIVLRGPGGASEQVALNPATAQGKQPPNSIRISHGGKP